MGYKISMALWEKGFVEKEYGICFAEPYIIYDSRGDSIEGGEDQPWATNQSLQLSKNQIGSFECDIPYELWHERYHLNRDDLVERLTYILVEEDGSILFVGYLTEKSLTFDRSMRVYFTECLGALDESDMVLDPKEYLLTCEADGSYGGEGKPPSLYYTILDRANMVNPIEPMQYEAPTVQRAVKKDLSDDGQQIGTAWSFLQKYFLDEYDGYFYVKYVKDEAHPGFFRIVVRYELDIGDKTDQTVEYGKNLLDLDIEQGLPSDFCNEVCALGTNTTTRGWWIFKRTTVTRIKGTAVNKDSCLKYGTIKRQLYVDGNATQQSLEKAAKEELANHPQESEMSMTVTAYDLADIGMQTDRLRYMKKTRIISTPHGIDGLYVCTKVDIDPADPAGKQFTFGNPPKKLTDQQNKASALAENIRAMVGGVIGYLNT